MATWCGFFWLCLCNSMVGASFQPRSPELARALRVMTVLWALDSGFVKLWTFRRSGVINQKEWLGGGIADAVVSVLCWHFSKRADPTLPDA